MARTKVRLSQLKNITVGKILDENVVQPSTTSSSSINNEEK